MGSSQWQGDQLSPTLRSLEGSMTPGPQSHKQLQQKWEPLCPKDPTCQESGLQGGSRTDSPQPPAHTYTDEEVESRGPDMWKMAPAWGREGPQRRGAQHWIPPTSRLPQSPPWLPTTGLQLQGLALKVLLSSRGPPLPHQPGPIQPGLQWFPKPDVPSAFTTPPPYTLWSWRRRMGILANRFGFQSQCDHSPVTSPLEPQRISTAGTASVSRVVVKVK